MTHQEDDVLDCLAWCGPLKSVASGEADLSVVPFVLHDRGQFLPRLQHADGSLSVYPAMSTLDAARKKAILEAEHWMLEQAWNLRATEMPALARPEVVHVGPHLVVNEFPDDEVICPVVVQVANGGFYSQLTINRMSTPGVNSYFVAGPFRHMDVAKDTALVAAFTARLGYPAGGLSAVPEQEVAALGLQYLVEAAQWAESCEDDLADLACAKTTLQDACDINRLLVRDVVLADLLSHTRADTRDRLIAAGARAVDLLDHVEQHQLRLNGAAGSRGPNLA